MARPSGPCSRGGTAMPRKSRLPPRFSLGLPARRGRIAAMEGPSGGARQVATTSVVALWHEPGSAVPPPLAAALASKEGLLTTRISSPFMALAVLCRLARDADTQPDRIALVVVYPER